MSVHVVSELATPGEVAAELRVSVATVKRWLRSGDLPGVRLPSGVWRVQWSEVRALALHRDHSDRPALERPIGMRP